MEDNLSRILLGAGVLFQYLRASAKFPEWAYVALAGAVASASWVLVNGWLGVQSVTEILAWLPTGIGLIFGGTFAMSKASTGIAAMGVPESHPALPVTNSKQNGGS